jgi:translation initiation factor 1 (eIF-1/SUI1)
MTDNQIIFSDNTISFEDNDFNEVKIIIFSERRGRKTNTYIIDWNIEKEEIKEHLKNLKRKHGCNGSIKTKIYQGEDKNVLHLQGEWKSEIKEYLLSLDVTENNIEVKV